MTNALAVIGLTYDGEDLQAADLQIFLEIARGLGETPTVRGVDTVVPALAGRVEGNRVNDVLPIELAGFVSSDPTATTLADARASFASNRAALRSLFASNRARAALVATLEDGSQLTIMARPMPGIIWTPVMPSEWENVSISLEGYDDWAVVP